jgi:hypothetical protein
MAFNETRRKPISSFLIAIIAGTSWGCLSGCQRKSTQVKIPFPDCIAPYATALDPSMRDFVQKAGDLSFFTTRPASEVLQYYTEQLRACGFALDGQPTKSRYLAVGSGNVNQPQGLQAVLHQDGREIRFELAFMQYVPPGTGMMVYGSWWQKGSDRSSAPSSAGAEALQDGRTFVKLHAGAALRCES